MRVNKKRQILLGPVVLVPADETWLWEVPDRRLSVKRALRQAKSGEFEDLGSFAQFASDDD